jgi:hypothetical protein
MNLLEAARNISNYKKKNKNKKKQTILALGVIPYRISFDDVIGRGSK